MKLIYGGLLVLLLLLQYSFWFGEGSFLRIRQLKHEVALQQSNIDTLVERNQTLDAEVYDLKHRLEALEERARTDLGMLREGETFYQYSMGEREEK